AGPIGITQAGRQCGMAAPAPRRTGDDAVLPLTASKPIRSSTDVPSAADLKSLRHLQQARSGTSNPQAALDALRRAAHYAILEEHLIGRRAGGTGVARAPFAVGAERAALRRDRVELDRVVIDL